MHQWYWSYEYSDFVTESGESIDFDVRGVMSSCREFTKLNHYYYMVTTPHLINWESPLMNIACEMKAACELNQIKLTKLQVVSPMIKAKLLEPNHLETSINRYCHFWDGAINMFLPLNQRGIKVVNITHVVRNDENDESLVSKGDERTGGATVGLPKSLNTHGNGVSIIPVWMTKSSIYGRGNTLRKESDTINNLSKCR